MTGSNLKKTRSALPHSRPRLIDSTTAGRWWSGSTIRRVTPQRIHLPITGPSFSSGSSRVHNQSDWTDLSDIENYFFRVWSDRRNKARSSHCPPPSQLPPFYFCRPFDVYELHPTSFTTSPKTPARPPNPIFCGCCSKPVQSINDLSIVSIEPAPMSPTYSTSPSTTVLPEKVIQSLAHHYDPAINKGPLSSHTLISPSRNPSRNPSLLVQLLVILLIRYVSVPRPRFVHGQISFGFFHSDVHSQTGS